MTSGDETQQETKKRMQDCTMMMMMMMMSMRLMILSWVLSGCMDQTSHKHESSQGDSGRDTGFDQFVAMVLKA